MYLPKCSVIALFQLVFLVVVTIQGKDKILKNCKTFSLSWINF